MIHFTFLIYVSLRIFNIVSVWNFAHHWRERCFNPYRYSALPRQKEVMTIFMFSRYGTKTKFCLIYPTFNKKFRLFDVYCMSIKGIWHYDNIYVLVMITNLHKNNKIGQIIWSLLPFAVVFLKLAYLFCVQIVRKQQCFTFFSLV